MSDASAERVKRLVSAGRSLEALSAAREELSRDPTRAVLGELTESMTTRAIAALGLQAFRPLIAAAAELASRVEVPTPANDARLHNLRSAAELVNRARHVFADEAELYVAEALIRRRLSDAGTALAVAREGSARFPDDWACRASLVTALADAGLPDEALDEAEIALSIDPSDGSPLYEAALGFVKLENWSDAGFAFEDLLHRFPDYRDAEAWLATAWVRKRDA